MNKKAIEMSFHWIFVVLVGASFMVFFFNIVNKQQEIGEQNVEFTIKNNIDRIISFSATQSSTSKTINIAKTKLELVCEQPDSSFISIGKNDLRRQVGSDTIFMPKLLEGKTLSLWTREWSAPFVADNFLYISNENTKYIFVSEEGGLIETELYDDFPNEFNKALSRPGSYGEILGSFDSYVFISENGISTTEIDVAEEKVTTIEVDLTDNRIRFNDVEDSYFYGKEMLFGAIIAADRKLYDCTTAKALKKHKLISQTLRKRADILKNVNPSARCNAVLNDYALEDVNNPFYWLLEEDNGISNNLIEGYSSIDEVSSENLFKKPYVLSSGSFSSIPANFNFYDAVEKLEDDAKGLRLVGVCDYVY